MAEGGYDFDDENHPLLEEDDYDDGADRGVMAERFSASDLCSDGCVVWMWVWILAATVVLVSLSKTLYCNCFSSPSSINGYLWG